jgi:hypothetical protein
MDAEARAERGTAALLASPATAGTKRERQRLARMDQELPFLVAFVEDIRSRHLASTRERVLQFGPIGRYPAEEVLDRALKRGFLAERGRAVVVTALGRKLRSTAFG